LEFRRVLFRSVILLQIHASIKGSNFFSISIKEQSRSASGIEKAIFANPAFVCLAPSWMVYMRVNVGVEPIFIGCLLLPGSGRLFFNKADLGDRLDAFEAIFPRDDKPDWCSISVR